MERSEEIFLQLDRDGDGLVSRSDLQQAARALDWGWHQAPIFSVLDRLTIEKGLDQDRLISILNLIALDPNGPYGQVLMHHADDTDPEELPVVQKMPDFRDSNPLFHHDLAPTLHNLAGARVAKEYDYMLRDLPTLKLDPNDSALFIIDPQRSFTQGAWMHSMGPSGEDEVQPIRLAFQNAARVLKILIGKVYMAFSRCPFPPDSYDWDPAIESLLPKDQIYFIKPGNSILWPPTNGFASWVESLLLQGKRTLVMGGCTLNSCVRVSAREVQKRFSKDGIRVVVDLSLSGARLTNYIPTSAFSGKSSVHAAIVEMGDSGVDVVPNVTWSTC